PGANGNTAITLSGGSLVGQNLTVNAGGTATFPAGTYVLNNVTCAGTLNFTGAATVYVKGTLNFTGLINTYGNRPQNLVIMGVSSAMTMSPAGDLFADIYNPGGSLTFNGAYNGSSGRDF